MRLHEAAQILGVHYQTAYGWVRSGRLPARLVAGSYDIADADLRAFQADRQTGSKPTTQIQVRDWTAQVARLYRAIAEGEETQARRAMDRLADSVTMTDLCDRIIAPALRQIGDAWQVGVISIAEEHRATAICERLIVTHSGQPVGRPRGTAIVTTPEGERHGMPALMAAATLRENHWYVHHLGADLPATEISTLAAQTGARLVVLCTSTEAGADSATEATSVLHAAVPDLTVLVGQAGEKLADLRHRLRS